MPRWTTNCGLLKRWLSANAMLIVRAGGIDWQRLEAQAVTRHFSLRLRETLWYLSTVMGASIPAEALARVASLFISFRERFEYRVKIRTPGVLGELPTYRCNYLRARRGGVLQLLGFARYLQMAWGLESLRHVPGRAWTLAAQRLKTRLRVRPRPQVSPS